MRIGVISDTHGQPLPTGVSVAFNGCAHIIHAGDIGSVSSFQGQLVLDELETIAPVTAVQGNSWGDHEGELRTSTGLVRNTGYLYLGGAHWFVAHKPTDIPVLRRMAAEKGVATHAQTAFFIHGHTHIPKVQRLSTIADPSAWYSICPGSISNPRGGSKPSVALITVLTDEPPLIELIEVG